MHDGLARPVDLVAVRVDRDVGGEVPAELAVEVRRDVGVRPVDTGVDDPDEHLLVAALDAVRAVGGRVDLLHVPLQIGEWLGFRATVVTEALFGVDGHLRLVSASRPAFSTTSRSAGVRTPAAGALPMIVFSATPSTPSPEWRRWTAKEASLERTVATPTAVFSLTISPPVAAITAPRLGRAFAVDDDVFGLPLLYPACWFSDAEGARLVPQRRAEDGCEWE